MNESGSSFYGLDGMGRRGWLDGRKRLGLIACRVLWREFNHFGAQSPHDVEFVYLEQGLHESPDRLRAAVQQEIDRAGDRHDALLLGYGLCSNGIVGLRAGATPLVVPRAHDCITLLLGGKERYLDCFHARPGTYWYSPGWIDCCDMPGPARFEKLRRLYAEKYGEELAPYLMEKTESWVREYSNLAYVDLGFGDTGEYKRFARECAQSLGWNYEEIAGDASLVCDFLNGNWREDAFLVVPPGHTIAADLTRPTIIRAE
jgi:hypothetical protein